jgi:hypothetical protein
VQLHLDAIQSATDLVAAWFRASACRAVTSMFKSGSFWFPLDMSVMSGSLVCAGRGRFAIRSCLGVGVAC